MFSIRPSRPVSAARAFGARSAATTFAAGALAAFLALPNESSAQERASPVGSAPGTPEPVAASTNPISQPSFGGPLKPNPNPASVDLGAFGPVYATGVLSGLGLHQNNVVLGDRGDRIDLSNAQLFVQKPDGVVQYYVQAGVYKITSLGAIDRNALEYTRQLYGPVPVAFVKFAPTDSFSIQAGKLPTLIGPEAPFTFQNVNIQRGLLFNQTNSINRGVQANYTQGPVTVALSFNDGFYSDRFNWVTGAVTYKIDDSNTLVFDAGANLGRTAYQTVAAPLLQNNSSMYNLIYTYSSGPWSVSPFLQYTNVPRDTRLGITEGASTYGAAVLVSYAVTPELSFAGRAEYIAQSGNRQTGITSLLYGPGSQAVSVTFTPTYQRGVFFARGEVSYVKAFDTTSGFAFGRAGSSTSQTRLLLETGLVF